MDLRPKLTIGTLRLRLQSALVTITPNTFLILVTYSRLTLVATTRITFPIQETYSGQRLATTMPIILQILVKYIRQVTTQNFSPSSMIVIMLGSHPQESGLFRIE